MAFDDNVDLLLQIVKDHAPIEDFFIVYQRVMSGTRRPGDVVNLARRLIAIFGGDRASLLWRLGSSNQSSMMRWQLVLQKREGALVEFGDRIEHYAERLKKRRTEAEIFNAIQSLVDEGKPLKEALTQVAGHGVAKGKGAETIRKIWLAKNREIKAGEPRLRPAGGMNPFAAEVIAPGKPAKKTGRPKEKR
jgi:hypothetical protein